MSTESRDNCQKMLYYFFIKMSNTQSETTTFGLHLMLDAYDCDHEKLGDGAYIYKVLDELSHLIGMTQLTKPYVVHATGNQSHDPGGWSGFVMIEESHLSIHTFVNRKFFTADIYSCRQFDTEPAVDYLKKAFGTNDIVVYTQKRGLRYPAENLI